MRALILGAAGQDGSYLTEHLTAQGVDVWGLVRRPSAHLAIPTVIGDLLDQDSLEAALTAVKPDVVYNLAAVTAPGVGWGVPQPPLLAEVTGLGVVKLLDAMLRRAPEARLVHASSSAIYDQKRYGVYGIAKTFAHQAVQGYRGRLHCSNAILFSHTSPRQDPRFLAPRIFATIARIAAGSTECLELGDVDSRRTWGYAADYMGALPLMSAAADPGDWVISTGEPRSVRELTESALKTVGLEWADVVVLDPDAPRVPDEIADTEGHLATDEGLGWRAQTGLEDLAELMLGQQ